MDSRNECPECERVITNYLRYPEDFRDAMQAIKDIAEHAKIHGENLHRLGSERIRARYTHDINILDMGSAMEYFNDKELVE